MSRCALFVDAGYALADGAMAVHGTRRQDSVSWDHAGLIKLLAGLAKDRTGLPVLRCYWYEAAVDGHRTPDQDALAEMPGVKLRLASTRPGRREGVEALLRRDLGTLAKNKAITEAVVLSADEGLAEVVAEVQELGLRVIVLHIASDSGWTVPQSLRQESDDLVEISGTHLRPFVELRRGAEPASSSERYGTRGTGTQHSQSLAPPAPGGSYAVSPGEYLQPFAAGQAQPQLVQGSDISQQMGAPGGQVLNGSGYGAQSAGDAGAQPPAAQPNGAAQSNGAAPPNGAGLPGQYGGSYLAGANGNGGANGASQNGASQNGASQNGASQNGASQNGASQNGAAQNGAYLNGVPQNGAYPNGAAQNGSGQNGAYLNGSGVNGKSGDWQVSPNPAGASPYGQFGNGQADGLPGTNGSGLNGAGYEAAPVAGQGQNSYADPNSAYLGGLAGPVAGLPEQPAQPPGQPGGSYQAGSYLGIGQQPAGNEFQHGEQFVQPAQYAPAQYQPGQFQQPGQFLIGDQYPGPGLSEQAGQPQQQAGLAFAPGGQFRQPAQPPPGGQVQAGGQLERAAPAPAARPLQPPALPLPEAVKAAHAEGYGFGESVGRDAPSLWLDAVLARKPRMPSDLEARLLQGSALPIDSLLHDEVRHSLRRGFWDALETARR